MILFVHHQWSNLTLAYCQRSSMYDYAPELDVRVVTARSMFMYFVPGYKSYKGSPFIKGCGEVQSFQAKGEC